MSESLTLKWGTIKGWNEASKETNDRIQRYFGMGHSLSAITQRDTPGQVDLICEIIDGIEDDGKIFNDWSGEVMTKEQAKTYVHEYRRPTEGRSNG